jgi:hypothetical protein
VQVGDEHLRHGQAVGGCLLGDLFQSVDPAELDLAAVAAELVDGAGEPLAGLALQSQFAGGGGLLAVLSELLEAEHRAGKNGQPGDGLQSGGAQIIL